MIRDRALPENIVGLLDSAIRYLDSRTDIMFAYLFGSLARGEPFPLSDVDIAVYLSEGIPFLPSKMAILGDLVDILKTDEIDLVVLNNAPMSLKMRILRNRRVIVDKAPLFRHKFESLVMRSGFDFAVKEAQILERRYLGG